MMQERRIQIRVVSGLRVNLPVVRWCNRGNEKRANRLPDGTVCLPLYSLYCQTTIFCKNWRARPSIVSDIGGSFRQPELSGWNSGGSFKDCHLLNDLASEPKIFKNTCLCLSELTNLCFCGSMSRWHCHHYDILVSNNYLSVVDLLQLLL